MKILRKERNYQPLSTTDQSYTAVGKGGEGVVMLSWKAFFAVARGHS